MNPPPSRPDLDVTFRYSVQPASGGVVDESSLHPSVEVSDAQLQPVSLYPPLVETFCCDQLQLVTRVLWRCR